MVIKKIRLNKLPLWFTLLAMFAAPQSVAWNKIEKSEGLTLTYEGKEYSDGVMLVPNECELQGDLLKAFTDRLHYAGRPAEWLVNGNNGGSDVVTGACGKGVTVSKENADTQQKDMPSKDLYYGHRDKWDRTYLMLECTGGKWHKVDTHGRSYKHPLGRTSFGGYHCK